jgi:hypothetical protein
MQLFSSNKRKGLGLVILYMIASFLLLFKLFQRKEGGRRLHRSFYPSAFSAVDRAYSI